MLARLLAPPLCWGCRGAAPAHEALCSACRMSLRQLGPDPLTMHGVECWAPLAYEGAARELVRALKYRGAQRLAGPMAARIAATAPEPFLASGPSLVPVPLHRARERRRGFNQAALIAAALAERMALPAAAMLARGAPAESQVGRARGERLAMSAEGIALRREAAAPSNALLVDDVITTGATLAACARALRNGGATEVRGLAFARTLSR